MAVSRTIGKKAPSQPPKDFYECKQAGGTMGTPNGKVGDRLQSGAVREKIDGRADLAKQK